MGRSYHSADLPIEMSAAEWQKKRLERQIRTAVEGSLTSLYLRLVCPPALRGAGAGFVALAPFEGGPQLDGPASWLTWYAAGGGLSLGPALLVLGSVPFAYAGGPVPL